MRRLSTARRLVLPAAAFAVVASCGAFAHTRAEVSEGCAAGSADDCMALGYMMEKGQGGARSAVDALARFERSCELGSPIGCERAAELLEGGTAGRRDPKRAAAYRKRARELGARACGG